MIQPANNPKLKALLEAARRADWDAQQGPQHLRAGRFDLSIPEEKQTLRSKPDGSKHTG